MKQPENKTKKSLNIPEVDKFWENPVTGNICGYERKRQLQKKGVKFEEEGKLVNPKSGKLVGFFRAKQLGLA